MKLHINSTEHIIIELDSIYSMHKNKKEQKTTTKNNNKENKRKKKTGILQIDLTQVLKVYLEVMPLKSLGRELQSFASVNSNILFHHW